jgi:hypothetical protein
MHWAGESMDSDRPYQPAQELQRILDDPNRMVIVQPPSRVLAALNRASIMQ